MHETTIARLLQQLEEGHEVWVESTWVERILAKNFTTGYFEMVMTYKNTNTTTLHELPESSVRMMFKVLDKARIQSSADA